MKFWLDCRWDWGEWILVDVQLWHGGMFIAWFRYSELVANSGITFRMKCSSNVQVWSKHVCRFVDFCMARPEDLNGFETLTLNCRSNMPVKMMKLILLGSKPSFGVFFSGVYMFFFILLSLFGVKSWMLRRRGAYPEDCVSKTQNME